jgi:hypothetical protein
VELVSNLSVRRDISSYESGAARRRREPEDAMTTTATRSLARLTPTLLVAAALAGSTTLALPASADAAVRVGVTTASLLTVEDVQASGLPADSATVTATGDAQLNDGGHYDENCLRDKTIRAITGAKSYPARGTGNGYADAVVTSTLDKEVYVSESVAQARTAADTDRYVAMLTQQVVDVAQCQEDPAQGIRHAPVRGDRVERDHAPAPGPQRRAAAALSGTELRRRPWAAGLDWAGPPTCCPGARP